jgi:hypothetical protein
MRGFLLVLLVGLLTLPHSADAQSPARPRHGVVHGDRHAFADDGGAFLPRGATMLWALWGYQHDRARLGRNLSTLRGWGIDYIRVLGVVGAPGRPAQDSWRDRQADPSAASYDQDIAGLTDWAYREYGLRVQWTIFGGVEFAPTPELRRAVVERFGNMSRGREEKIFAFEVANEAWQNGFGDEAGRLELHALAQLLKTKSSNLVALSAPQESNCAAAQALYRGSAADLLTVHLPRAGMEKGAIWSTFRDPSAFRECAGVPTLASSNEPIGPESSVAAADDPAVLAALAAVTYGSGIGAFVLHTGPGVRGGGAADLARGRHSNVWELPTGARIAAALSSLISKVPGDFANWEKQDVLDVSEPSALAGMYCFSKASSFACIAFGIARPFQVVTRRAMSVTVHQFVSNSSAPAARLQPSGRLAIPATPPVRLIIGS